MPEPILTKLGMYIMAPEPISTPYFINPSHQSVCVSLLSLLSNGSISKFPWQRIHATIYELLDACVCLCIRLSLLGNGSVKTFLRKRRTVGGVVFYAVHVVSEESRRLVLPRSSCFNSRNPKNCWHRTRYASAEGRLKNKEHYLLGCGAMYSLVEV
jgi:hypothetical protein